MGQTKKKRAPRPPRPPEFYAKMGKKGGKATARKHGPKYFKKLQKKRKTRAGGRPPKEEE